MDVYLPLFLSFLGRTRRLGQSTRLCDAQLRGKQNMRKTILTLALLLTNTAFAQQPPGEIIDLVKPLKCSRAESVMNFFAEKFKEKPLWVGKTSTGTHIVLMVNKETKTWTLIEYDSALACVLGAGETSSSTDGMSI